MKLRSSRGKTFSQVLSEARTVIEQVPGLTYGLFEAGPFGQKPIQISVRGPEVDELDRLSRELMGAMSKTPGVASMGAVLIADAANDRFQMQWIATDTANRAMYFTATYEVI